jgi:hypothetical protein
MGRKVVGEPIIDKSEEIPVQLSQGEKYELELKALVEKFYNINTDVKELDAIAKSLNAQIKEIMLDHKLTTFDFDNYKVKCSTVESTKFDEDILLAIIKDIGRPDLIKTREYVDLNDVEQAIYREEFDAAILEPAQKITEQVRLQVSMKKGKS